MSCAVVECYRAWCGPTAATLPFRQLRSTYLLERKRLHLMNVCTDEMAPFGGERLKSVGTSARPHYLIFCNGEWLQTIEGINVDALERIVAAHLPAGEVQDDGQGNDYDSASDAGNEP
jgi:hypothetical protein